MLTNVGEVRAAVMQVTGVANRTLSILTHDLEPDVYDHDDFLETLKKFILARTFARVRVLILAAGASACSRQAVSSRWAGA